MEAQAAASAPIAHPGLGHLFCPLAETALAWGGLGVSGHSAALPPGLLQAGAPLALGVPDLRNAASASGHAEQPVPGNQCGAESPVNQGEVDANFAAAIGHPPHALRDAAVLMREFGDAGPDPAHSHMHQHVHHFHANRNAIPPPIPGYISMVCVHVLTTWKELTTVPFGVTGSPARDLPDPGAVSAGPVRSAPVPPLLLPSKLRTESPTRGLHSLVSESASHCTSEQRCITHHHRKEHVRSQVQENEKEH